MELRHAWTEQVSLRTPSAPRGRKVYVVLAAVNCDRPASIALVGGTHWANKVEFCARCTAQRESWPESCSALFYQMGSFSLNIRCSDSAPASRFAYIRQGSSTTSGQVPFKWRKQDRSTTQLKDRGKKRVLRKDWNIRGSNSQKRASKQHISQLAVSRADSTYYRTWTSFQQLRLIQCILFCSA